MDQALNSQKTPHTSPLRASYGMSFVSILMKNDRVIKGFYCIVRCLDCHVILSRSSCAAASTCTWNLFWAEPLFINASLLSTKTKNSTEWKSQNQNSQVFNNSLTFGEDQFCAKILQWMVLHYQNGTCIRADVSAPEGVAVLLPGFAINWWQN